MGFLWGGGSLSGPSFPLRVEPDGGWPETLPLSTHRIWGSRLSGTVSTDVSYPLL